MGNKTPCHTQKAHTKGPLLSKGFPWWMLQFQVYRMKTLDNLFCKLGSGCFRFWCKTLVIVSQLKPKKTTVFWKDLNHAAVFLRNISFFFKSLKNPWIPRYSQKLGWYICGFFHPFNSLKGSKLSWKITDALPKRIRKPAFCIYYVASLHS